MVLLPIRLFNNVRDLEHEPEFLVKIEVGVNIFGNCEQGHGDFGESEAEDVRFKYVAILNLVFQLYNVLLHIGIGVGHGVSETYFVVLICFKLVGEA